MNNRKNFLILMVFFLFIVFCVSCTKNNHKWKDATCEEPKLCTECGATEGNPLGHNFLDWHITKQPTTYEKGEECRYCSRCNKKETRILEELSSECIHEFLDATCTTPKKCKNCGIEEGLPSEHQFSEWYEVNQADYKNDGQKRRDCKNCDYFETDVINKLTPEEHLEEVINKINLPTETKENIKFIKELEEVKITWKPVNNKLITEEGIIKRGPNKSKTTINATFYFNGISKTVDYKIVILGYTVLEKLQIVMEKITFPDIVYNDLEFYSSYSYGIKGKFESSNIDSITNEGRVFLKSEEVIVTITVTLTLEDEIMEKDFIVKVGAYSNNEKSHQVIERFSNVNNCPSDNLEILNGKLVLKNNVIEGIYESDIINTAEFKSLVASWAAETSKNATVELMVRAFIDGSWSGYITYSQWGLGLQNSSYDQNNGKIKLSTDEIIVLDQKVATAIQYKVILRRKVATVDSPKLSLVSFALEIPNYSYYINSENIKEGIVYDVPKLCQNVVPGIGNSICSATSTTMLLKYKGLSFSEFDSQFEHRYIAGIVKDYGNNIYGNWVYNTVAMGGYGFNAYVARMYSIEELLEHLSQVGPVALSVKGTMISSEKTYTTAGHLIVAIGFKWVENKLFIICNDPNVANVYCEYSVDVINTTWRKIAYVIE